MEGGALTWLLAICSVFLATYLLLLFIAVALLDLFAIEVDPAIEPTRLMNGTHTAIYIVIPIVFLVALIVLYSTGSTDQLNPAAWEASFFESCTVTIEPAYGLHCVLYVVDVCGGMTAAAYLEYAYRSHMNQ